MPRLNIFRLPTALHRRARRSRIATLTLLTTTLLLLCLPLYLIYKPPTFLIRAFQRHWPDVLWQVSTSEKVIALTIDDAPSQHTERILELLKAHGATATFFVIGGNIPGREDVLAKAVAAGNELGNHAMHDEPSRNLPDAQLVSEIHAVQASLESIYIRAAQPSPPPRYFRPGSGFYSTRMRDLVRKLNYRLVLGNIYPHDPQIKFWQVNSAHILSMLRPGGIVICHDGREWTVPMLEEVLPEARRRGYRVVSVGELLEIGGGST